MYPNVIFPSGCHIAVLAIFLNLYLLTIICLKPTFCLIVRYPLILVIVFYFLVNKVCVISRLVKICELLIGKVCVISRLVKYV